MPSSLPLRPAPRARFNRSPLVRCLEGLGLNEGPDAGPTLAEHLGQWLDWRDAIALFEALQGADGSAVTAPQRASGSAAADRLASLRGEADRVRHSLARDITEDGAWGDHGAGRTQHAAWQRSMEAQVAALRARVRAAASAASPELARLATLDGLMERALAVRERQLLSNVPVLLEAGGGGRSAEADQATGIDTRTWQRTLLAELELRLQPVEGLLEAWAAQHAPATPERATSAASRTAAASAASATP